jgi:hypothetical protein
MSPRHPISRPLLATAAIGVALALVACGATREFGRGVPEESGFLRDYSQLKPNPDYPAAKVYIRPGVVWSRYDSVQIDTVTAWTTEEKGKLSEEERQMLTDTLFKALHDQIGQYIQLADQPGPTTLRLRAALTEAEGANVALRTITTVVPQLRLLSTMAGLSADVAETVGTATLEAEVLDSLTGQRLAAAVDSRAGNKALFSGRTFQKWGDVEAAAKLWASRVTWQLVRHGVRRKPGAGEPEEPEA